MNVRGWRDEGTPPAGEEYLIFPLRVRPMDRPLRRRGELAGEFGGEATCVVARLWPLDRSVGGRAYTCMCSLPFCISGSDSTRGHPSVFGALFILTRKGHLHLPSPDQQQILPPPPQNLLPSPPLPFRPLNLQGAPFKAGGEAVLHLLCVGREESFEDHGPRISLSIYLSLKVIIT